MSEHSFHPKVSIVIPVYNGANYLENAINCALSQTYDNLEVIVVNDGSNDEGATERIAQSFGSRIRYFSKSNGGVSSALNLGIREMTGEYFSWLSHDDAYTPQKIADAVAVLDALGETDGMTIAYTGGNYIDKDSVIVKSFSVSLEPHRKYSGREMVCNMIEHGVLNGCCMLIPRCAFEKCGGFNEELRYSQDALMWYQMFFQDFGLVHDGKANVMYRLHPAQTSHTKHELFDTDAAYIAEVIAPQLVQHSDERKNLVYQYALRMAKYRCEKVVQTMRRYAVGSVRFTWGQNLRIRLQLLYGSMRGTLKHIYYRYILKVRV